MLKVLAAALLLTALYNFLVFNSQPGIGFSLFIVFINLTVFALGPKPKNIFLSYGFGISSAIFALLLSFRSNGVVQLVDLLASVSFLLLNIYFSKANIKFNFSYLNLLTAPLKAGVKFAEGVLHTFVPQTWAEHSAKKHVTSSLLRGLFIGVPILMVLFIILSKADPVFENITFSFLEDVWIRIMFSLIIFISTLSLGIMKISETDKEKEINQISIGKEYELLVILGGLALLFGGFIFIQFKYLFSGVGERELANLGIQSLTYSEYVRRGFFELLLASSLAAGVIFYSLKYIHKLKGKGKLLVQIFTSIVSIEVGMLLYSAALRVFLYQEAHGFTRARVLGMFFLVWLAVLLIILLIRIVKDINSKTYLTLNIITTLIVLIAINWVNVDGLIATHENKPTVNNEIDYYYLANLSPDAHDSWIPAIQDAERVLTTLNGKQLTPEDYRIFYWHSGAIEAINSHVDYLKNKYGPYDKAVARHAEIKKTIDPGYALQVYGDKPLTDNIYEMRKWQAVNLGEYQAYIYTEQYLETFSKLPAMVENFRSIQSGVSPEVMNSAVLDRSTDPPF